MAIADGCKRFLSILGIPREKPHIDALGRIVRAHLTTVPFENISKLYYLRTAGLTTVPDLDRYLDGIERYHFGGHVMRTTTISASSCSSSGMT